MGIGVPGEDGAHRLNGAGQLLLDAGEPPDHRSDAEHDANQRAFAARKPGADRKPGYFAGLLGRAAMVRDYRRLSICRRHGYKIRPGAGTGGQLDSAGGAEYGDGAVGAAQAAAGGPEPAGAHERTPVRCRPEPIPAAWLL